MRKEDYFAIAGAIAIASVASYKAWEDSTVSATTTSLRGPGYAITRGYGEREVKIETFTSWNVRTPVHEGVWIEEAVNRLQEQCGPITGIGGIRAKPLLPSPRGLTMQVSVPNRERCFPKE